MESPLKYMDDWEVPLFLETSIWLGDTGGNKRPAIPAMLWYLLVGCHAFDSSHHMEILGFLI